ncbi:MAG: Grx4 family monothiol glutaredoxin [Euryarchaeota archaeon]|nr:Grx4 family monothiol glutaredoxin [Euryarchaeota archaeon]
MTLPIAQGPEGQETPALDPELKLKLDRLVQENDLVLFMKGNPDAPQCGFSARAAEVYKAIGRPFEFVNVLEQPDMMQYIRAVAEWADWPTLPQCWVKGELIGGSDVALEMYQNGELQAMLDE